MDDQAKKELAMTLASRVEDKQIIGVGTGTTVEAVLSAVKERVDQENLDVAFLPTSYQSAWRCEELGLRVLSPALHRKLDWAFDGADEVDSKLRLLKGRGAALLHEKLVAAKTSSFIVVVGEDKIVERLGERMAVPVEVIPESVSSVQASLLAVGADEVILRNAVAFQRTVPLFTQEGNIILDARFSEIPEDMENRINQIPGVVENGIFSSCATEVLVAGSGKIRVLS